MRSSDLLTRCGFGPGGEGVWRGSSSDELEFLKKNIVYHHLRKHHRDYKQQYPPKSRLVESKESKPAHLGTAETKPKPR